MSSQKIRKKSKRSSPSLGGGGRLGALKRLLARGLTRFSTSPLLLGLPLSLLFLSQLSDYLVVLHATDASSLLFFSAQPVEVIDPRRADAESLKKAFQAGLYLFLLLMCGLNWRAVYGYFREWPHLLLIVGMTLITATYSSEPSKVVTNSILILVSILIPLAFSIGYKQLDRRVVWFYVFMLVPFIMLHFGSLLLLFNYGVDPFTLIASPNRYGGLSGNPNSLGNTAVLGIWVCFAIMLSTLTNKPFKMFALLSAVVFMMSVALSGSGTALVASIVVVALLFWMRFVSVFSATVRAAIGFFAGALLIVGVLSVLLLVSPAEVFLLFTGSLGKDATLTGRTELWAMAKEAVAMKPWLGWSFDSHTSVKSVRAFSIPYNHFHNGYLDTMISGGVILLALVGYNLFWFAGVFMAAFRKNRELFALVVPVIMLVILNISEYSLLRPLSEIWHLYIASFVLITYNLTPPKEHARPVAVKRKRRKKSLRWA